MANSAPDTEFDLKKRLVGAFILIGFGVVILPALLGGEDPQFEGDQPPPTIDPKIFISKITPIGGATPPLTDVDKTDQLTDSAPPEPDPIVPVKPKTDDTKQTKAEAKPKPKPKPNPVVKPNREPGWVVQVGTFAKDDNVTRVVKRLQQAGFEPSTTKVKTDKGSVTRVWIGPYSQRVEAARMRSRVQQVTGGEGFIAAYP